jgi:hypothetical protein
MTIATTIIEQLGGNKFIAMTGAKNLSTAGSDLTLRLPTKFAKHGINCVRITYVAASDLYQIEWLNIRGLNVKQALQSSFGVYAEDLRRIFTETTGLETSLGTMRGAA